MTDEMLMLKVKADELDKLTPLFNRYHLQLFNFFVRMTYDKSISQDLTQSVFERIIRYRQSYKDSMKFKSWVFQIARNVYKDQFRLNKIQVDSSIEVNRLGVMVDSNDKEAVEQFKKRQLEEALTKLKPNYREMILLGWLQNIPYAELAVILDISETNVKVRMHRAIKSLQRIIQNSKVHE